MSNLYLSIHAEKGRTRIRAHTREVHCKCRWYSKDECLTAFACIEARDSIVGNRIELYISPQQALEIHNVLHRAIEKGELIAP